MNLTETQKTSVAAWVAEGCGLSEIQRRLASEFEWRATFMDVRFLVLDLGLEIQDGSGVREQAKPENEATEPLAEDDEAGDMEAVVPEAFPPPTGDAAVSVEVDRIMKPGALVSGSVTFSDGVTAAWMLDQYGRLALDAQQPGYRPSPADIEAFQRVLQEEVAKKGY